jgi:hypothetical protein
VAAGGVGAGSSDVLFHLSEDPTIDRFVPEPVGDLFDRHATAGIELRGLDNLWPWWDKVTTTTVGYSGIRLANARPR